MVAGLFGSASSAPRKTVCTGRFSGARPVDSQELKTVSECDAEGVKQGGGPQFTGVLERMSRRTSRSVMTLLVKNPRNRGN
jgi:hypothetical protein